jgi:hypothetical protein
MKSDRTELKRISDDKWEEGDAGMGTQTGLLSQNKR